MPTTVIGISAKPKDDGTYTCTIPLDALEQDGTPPEVGDSVSYQVDGTVQSIDGEDATVKVKAVNGEPVSETPEEENAEDETDNTGGGGGAGNSPGLAAMRKKLGGSGPPPGMAGMT